MMSGKNEGSERRHGRAASVWPEINVSVCWIATSVRRQRRRCPSTGRRLPRHAVFVRRHMPLGTRPSRPCGPRRTAARARACPRRLQQQLLQCARWSSCGGRGPADAAGSPHSPPVPQPFAPQARLQVTAEAFSRQTPGVTQADIAIPGKLTWRAFAEATGQRSTHCDPSTQHGGVRL